MWCSGVVVMVVVVLSWFWCGGGGGMYQIKSNQNVYLYRPLARYKVVPTNIHSQFTRFHARMDGGGM